MEAPQDGRANHRDQRRRQHPDTDRNLRRLDGTSEATGRCPIGRPQGRTLPDGQQDGGLMQGPPERVTARAPRLAAKLPWVAPCRHVVVDGRVDEGRRGDYVDRREQRVCRGQ
jgi:hypothetical protein